MTAAAILAAAQPPATQGGREGGVAAAGDGGGGASAGETSVEEEGDESLFTAAEAAAGVDGAGLATAVSILRQQPEDSSVGQLSQRLLRLLQLLDGPRAASAVAALPPPGVPVQSSFWGQEDDWSDIRQALLSAGVDASLDEGDEDGEVLQRLPRFDRATADTLALFLGDLQQRRVSQQQSGRPDAGGVVRASNGTGSGAGLDSGTGRDDAGAGDTGEADWWEHVTVAYDMLWQQAQAVKQEGK